MDRTTVLGWIANDAATLHDDLRRSAKRCHRAAANGTPDHERRSDELREYVQIGQRLFIAVAAHLPEIAKSLRFLSRDFSCATRPGFTSWEELESELRNVEVEALGALNRDDEDKSPPSTAISVDLSLNQIRYGGKCHNVSPDGALLVSKLAEASDWFPASSILSKPSDVLASLPGPIKSKIETQKGKGYRLKRV